MAGSFRLRDPSAYQDRPQEPGKQDQGRTITVPGITMSTTLTALTQTNRGCGHLVHVRVGSPLSALVDTAASSSPGSTSKALLMRATVRNVALVSPASTFCQCRQWMPARWAASSTVSFAASRRMRTLAATRARTCSAAPVRHLYRQPPEYRVGRATDTAAAGARDAAFCTRRYRRLLSVEPGNRYCLFNRRSARPWPRLEPHRAHPARRRRTRVGDPSHTS